MLTGKCSQPQRIPSYGRINRSRWSLLTSKIALGLAARTHKHAEHTPAATAPSVLTSKCSESSSAPARPRAHDHTHAHTRTHTSSDCTELDAWAMVPSRFHLCSQAIALNQGALRHAHKRAHAHTHTSSDCTELDAWVMVPSRFITSLISFGDSPCKSTHADCTMLPGSTSEFSASSAQERKGGGESVVSVVGCETGCVRA